MGQDMVNDLRDTITKDAVEHGEVKGYIIITQHDKSIGLTINGSFDPAGVADRLIVALEHVAETVGENVQ